MTDRLKRIFEEIPPCSSFADVGCDHGYIAEKMLEKGKCNQVIISDISAPSLKKAEKLLKRYIDSGLVRSICTDGLNGISEVETVLIAGMGGEEIIKILTQSAFLPKVLVLQPMKNVDKVRKKLFSLGYGITKDFLFYDKKYYNLIICKLGYNSSPYTEKEIIFGRDNLLNKSEDFKLYLTREIALMQECLKKAKAQKEIEELKSRLQLFSEVYNES